MKVICSILMSIFAVGNCACMLPLTAEDTVLSTSVDLDSSFFLFDDKYGVQTVNDELLLLVLLEDESRWGIPFTPDTAKVFLTWGRGDWFTVTPSSYVPGGYLIENKARSPGIELPCTKVKDPNPASSLTNKITELTLDAAVGNLKINQQALSVGEANQISVLNNWHVGDPVIVNKIVDCQKVDDVIIVSEKLVVSNLTTGTSVEAVSAD